MHTPPAGVPREGLIQASALFGGGEALFICLGPTPNPGPPASRPWKPRRARFNPLDNGEGRKPAGSPAAFADYMASPRMDRPVVKPRAGPDGLPVSRGRGRPRGGGAGSLAAQRRAAATATDAANSELWLRAEGQNPRLQNCVSDETYPTTHPHPHPRAPTTATTADYAADDAEVERREALTTLSLAGLGLGVCVRLAAGTAGTVPTNLTSSHASSHANSHPPPTETFAVVRQAFFSRMDVPMIIFSELLPVAGVSPSQPFNSLRADDFVLGAHPEHPVPAAAVTAVLPFTMTLPPALENQHVTLARTNAEEVGHALLLSILQGLH